MFDGGGFPKPILVHFSKHCVLALGLMFSKMIEMFKKVQDQVVFKDLLRHGSSLASGTGQTGRKWRSSAQDGDAATVTPLVLALRKTWERRWHHGSSGGKSCWM